MRRAGRSREATPHSYTRSLPIAVEGRANLEESAEHEFAVGSSWDPTRDDQEAWDAEECLGGGGSGRKAKAGRRWGSTARERGRERADKDREQRDRIGQSSPSNSSHGARRDGGREAVRKKRDSVRWRVDERGRDRDIEYSMPGSDDYAAEHHLWDGVSDINVPNLGIRSASEPHIVGAVHADDYFGVGSDTWRYSLSPQRKNSSEGNEGLSAGVADGATATSLARRSSLKAGRRLFLDRQGLRTAESFATVMRAGTQGWSRLRVLGLSDNRLTSLPSADVLQSMGFSSLKRLKVSCSMKELALTDALFTVYLHPFQLSSNDLRELPAGMGSAFPSLVELDISGNVFQEFPSPSSLPPSLVTIKASNNEFVCVSIPDAGDALPQLENLNLSDNPMDIFPMDVCALPRLRILDLSNNLLTDLPACIAQMQSLKSLQISQNNLLRPPQQTADAGLKSIRMYFQAREEGLIRSMSHFKVIFVGNHQSGKSSVIRRLQEESAGDTPSAAVTEKAPISWSGHPSTIVRTSSSSSSEEKALRISINTWTPVLSHKHSGDDSPRQEMRQLKLWDLAGAEVYHAVHGMFFSERALYIVVFDLTLIDSKEDINEHVQFWVDCIQAKIPSAHIQLVATRADLLSSEIRASRCEAIKLQLRRNEEGIRQALRVKQERVEGDQRCMRPKMRRHIRKMLTRRPNVQPDIITVSCTKGVFDFDALRDRILALTSDTNIFPVEEIPLGWHRVYEEVEGFRSAGLDLVSRRDFESLKGAFLEEALMLLNEQSEVVYFASFKKLKKLVWVHPHRLIDAVKLFVRKDLVQKLVHIADREAGEERAKVPAVTQADVTRLRQKSMLSSRVMHQLLSPLTMDGNFGSKTKDPREAILALLQKFGVVIRIEVGDDMESGITGGVGPDEPCYLVPCLLPDERIKYRFTGLGWAATGRTWRFQRFVPPGFFTHIQVQVYNLGISHSFAIRLNDMMFEISVTGPDRQNHHPAQTAVGAFRAPGDGRPESAKVLLRMIKMEPAEGYDIVRLELWARARSHRADELMRNLSPIVEAIEGVIRKYPGVLVESCVICPLCIEQTHALPASWAEFPTETVEKWRDIPGSLGCCDNGCDLSINQRARRLLFMGSPPAEEFSTGTSASFQPPPALTRSASAAVTGGPRSDLLHANSGGSMTGGTHSETAHLSASTIPPVPTAWAGSSLSLPTEALPTLYPAVVACGVYDTRLRRMKGTATAFIVDGDAGLLVSCAHTLMQWDRTRRGWSFVCEELDEQRCEWAEADSRDCIVLIGMPLEGQGYCEWTYVAEVLVSGCFSLPPLPIFICLLALFHPGGLRVLEVLSPQCNEIHGQS
jgi:Leucine-rich repeat (LRR) protein